MVKNSKKISKKSQKIYIFFKLNFIRNIFIQQQQYPFPFSILGLCNSTRALQSCPILRKKICRNLEKNTFFIFVFAIFFYTQFSNIRRKRFHQSSPVQPVSEFRGGSTSVTENERKKSSCLILDTILLLYFCTNLFFSFSLISFFILLRVVKTLRSIVETSSGSGGLTTILQASKAF